MQIFKPIPLVNNLPLDIECLSAYENSLVIATKQGHLMKYKFTSRNYAQITSLSSDVEVELVKSCKHFSKKPVTQVETVPEFRIVITLSDGLIHINSLDDLSVCQVIQKTKGATCFATNVGMEITLTHDQPILRMCVVVRRKIMLLYWKNKNFHDYKEINLNDQPRAISWREESLFIGYKSEYQLIQMEQAELRKEEQRKNLSPAGGKQLEPTIKLLQDGKVSLNRDENTFIFNQDGEAYLSYSISWSDIPLDMAEDFPYLIALLPSSIIEVRTVEPHLFIQRLELAQLTSNYSKIKILTKCKNRKGLIIAASSSDIFAIVAIPVDEQKAQMLSEKHFDLALKLANKQDATTRDIEFLYAHDLFQKKSFKEALNLFLKLDISPLTVIKLFPELSDESFIQQETNDNTSESDERTVALIDYLIQIRADIRTHLSRLSKNAIVGSAHSSASPSFTASQNDKIALLSQQMKSSRVVDLIQHEVDTTLLKCYLKTKNTLVASLLRLPDNHCKLHVTEKALIKYHKYNELIILYQGRGLHRKALELLKTHFQDSPNSGYEKTVSYLQHLGNKHLEIICEYAQPVLVNEPELGLKIFTADSMEAEHLDRNLVLEYLGHNAPSLEIPYLEHLIHFWDDKTSGFHNTLLLRYRQKVAPLLSDYINSIGDKVPSPAGQEPGELGELRRKLLDFLEISDHYTTQGLPALLLDEGLCEERAIVLGKDGQHEEALSIFIYVLNNPTRAEEYCSSVYKKKMQGSGDIFFLLLKLYLHPPETFSSNQLKRKMSVSSASHWMGDISRLKVIKLLNEHGDKIDPLKAIAELPNDFDLHSLRDYLKFTFTRKLQESHEKEMFRQLITSKFYQVQKKWIQLQKDNKIVIDDSTVCQVCNKKMGVCAFVRFSNSDLVHLACKDRYGKVVKPQRPSSDFE